MTATIIEPEVRETSGDDINDEMDHIICGCSVGIALCGMKLMGPVAPLNDEGFPADCVVCVDLVDNPCPRCGV